MSEQRKTTKTQSRRDEILTVAARVIAERGLAGATVRDIGEAAGILSGSLYHHFESKEQIVLDLLVDSVTEQTASARRHVEESPNAAAALEKILGEAVEEAATHPHRTLVLRNETRAFNDLPKLAPLAELRRESVAIWTSLVQQGIDEGTFRSDLDVDVAVMAIVDLSIGAARWFNGSRTKPSETVSATLVELALASLRAS